MALNDEERLRLLKESQLLDSAPEEAFDYFTRLAVALLDIPVSLVSLVDQDRQYFKSYCGLPEPWASRQQTSLSYSFCQYVVSFHKPLIVEDARTVAMLKENLAVAELGVIAYLGFPLLVRGQVLGSFCAIDIKPHAWSAWEVRMVQQLAGLVSEELVLRIEHQERQTTILRQLAGLVSEELVLRIEHQERQTTPQQERFLLQVNQSPVIIWQADSSGGITFLNTTWSRFTGLSEQESLGDGWLSAIHPDDRARLIVSGKRSAAPLLLSHAQVRLRRADGTYREVIGHSRPITDQQGTIRGSTGTLLPIIERTELERHWELFLGIVAHELKAPLTTLQTTIQLAERRLTKRLSDIDELSSGQRQTLLSGVVSLLAQSLEPIQLQTRLINELLDLSRMRSTQQLDVRMVPCDLGEIVRRVIREQQITHQQRVVLCDVAGETALLVLADALRVQQVLTNYVTNALKYSPPEKPVQVGITLASASVRVWVRDEGAGLSETQREQIWKPFYQVQDTTVVSALSSVGLGLSICKALMQAQHGNVGVESTPGEGSTFWFTLPLLQD